MKTIRFTRLTAFALLLTCTVWSCEKKDPPTPAPAGGNTGTSSTGGTGTTTPTPAPTTGTATFFTKEDLGVGNITVAVDGNAEGTISHYHASGVDCGQGDVNVIKAAGTYAFKATGGNLTWTGNITIKNGICQVQELVKSSGSGTTTGGATAQGQVTFWTAQTTGWSTIDVSVAGTYAGTIKGYYASIPSCGAAYGVTVTKPPGTYAYTAQSDKGDKWGGTIIIEANGCLTQRLIFSPTTTTTPGGTSASCDWATWDKYIKVTRYEFDQKGSYCGDKKGITYVEVQNLVNIDLSIAFCLKQPDGTWYCAYVDTGAGKLMKTNNCYRGTNLKVWARPYGKGSSCPFPYPK